jgi:hypothetical protein
LRPENSDQPIQYLTRRVKAASMGIITIAAPLTAQLVKHPG